MTSQPSRLTMTVPSEKALPRRCTPPEGDQIAGAGPGSSREANPEESSHAVSPFLKEPRGQNEHSHGCP
jgi:hypothetical protein